MADKFLESISLEEAEEAIRMTRLGQMLVNDGVKQGVEQTKLDNARSLIGLLDVKVIAERIGLPLETVLKLKEEKE